MAHSLLQELARIAPVTAVRGNNDRGTWTQRLPEVESVTVDRIAIFMIHDLAELPHHAPAKTARVVLSGLRPFSSSSAKAEDPAQRACGVAEGGSPGFPPPRE